MLPSSRRKNIEALRRTIMIEIKDNLIIMKKN